MTTREKTDRLPPLERIATLASDLDYLRSQVEHQIIQEKPLDDLVDLIVCAQHGHVVKRVQVPCRNTEHENEETTI